MIATLVDAPVLSAPRWVRWAKAATLVALFAVITAVVLEISSVVVEVTCSEKMQCTLVESTFATSENYSFEIRAEDTFTVDVRKGSKGGTEGRLLRDGGPIGIRFVHDTSGVQRTADALQQAAKTGQPPAPQKFGSRWNALLAVLFIFLGVLVAVAAILRNRE